MLLAKGELRRLPDSQGVCVQVLSGRLWLTQHDGTRDIVLEPGEEAVISRSGLSVLSALLDSRYLLLYQATPLARA